MYLTLWVIFFQIYNESHIGTSLYKTAVHLKDSTQEPCLKAKPFVKCSSPEWPSYSHPHLFFGYCRWGIHNLSTQMSCASVFKIKIKAHFSFKHCWSPSPKHHFSPVDPLASLLHLSYRSFILSCLNWHFYWTRKVLGNYDPP